MALSSVIFYAFALATTASAGDGCPMAMNTGSVGSCMVFGCSASRGATDCTHGTCYCKEGYCRYPASTVHVQSRKCVARVPGHTCHVSRFCYHGGLSKTFCEKGLCMCKFGYYWDADDETCKTDPSSLLAANYSLAEVEEMAEFQQQQDYAIALNVAAFSGWVTAVTAVSLAGLVAILRRKRTAPVTEYRAGLLAA